MQIKPNPILVPDSGDLARRNWLQFTSQSRTRSSHAVGQSGKQHYCWPLGLIHSNRRVMKAAVLVAYSILAAVAASLPTPIWDPVAHSILGWNASWPLYRNTPDTALLPPPSAAHAYVVSGGSAIGDIARGHLNGGYNSRYYYLKAGNSQFGTLDRNTEMRQFQEGMAMDAAQSPLPVGITEPMLAATGLAEWDTGAACAKVWAPELTDRSALVLVVDRFPASKGGKSDSKVDMAWDLASLFVSAIDPASRCWDGMNVYDTKSGKPCIQLQFVECSFRDGPAGDEVPLSLGFMFPTQVTHTCWPALVLCSLGDMPSDFDCASCQTLGHDKWNLKFQLNYKKHPVRAVQVCLMQCK